MKRTPPWPRSLSRNTITISTQTGSVLIPGLPLKKIMLSLPKELDGKLAATPISDFGLTIGALLGFLGASLKALWIIRRNLFWSRMLSLMEFGTSVAFLFTSPLNFFFQSMQFSLDLTRRKRTPSFGLPHQMEISIPGMLIRLLPTLPIPLILMVARFRIWILFPK